MPTKTVEQVNKEVGRMNPGTGYGGPEFYGCSNTGQRPIIRRMKRENGGLFIVGPQAQCDFGFAPREYREFAVGGGKPGRSIGKGPSRIWRFKSRRAAIAQFTELCNKVLDYNDRERAAEREHSAALHSGNLTVALTAALTRVQ